MAFADHAAQTLQLTTIGFNDPLPAGTAFIANGGLKVTVTSGAGTTWGSHYGTPADGDVVEIHPNALTIGAADGLITIIEASVDTVYGWTKSATAGQNDAVVTQLKPYAPAHGIMYNSGKLVGVAVSVTSNSTALNFVDNAGAANAADTITVTHAAGKHKEFMEDLMDVVADDNKVSGMVVVRDDMRLLNIPTTRGTAITGVA